MALTDVACRNVKPSDRDFKLAGSGQLYLLVRPNGSKLWRLNYRFQGKSKRYHGSREMDEAGEVDGKPVVAGCETTEMLEPVEASLDAVAVFVDGPVMGDEDLAIPPGGITASAFIAAIWWRKSLLS